MAVMRQIRIGATARPSGAPRVGIGLPVFNGGAFVREAVESILAQTFRDFELVVCDNASNDATPQVCAEYVERDSRVKYFGSDRNGGSAWNHNRALTLSRGEYFKWMAADDRLAPTFLERCVGALDASPDVVLSYTKTIVIDEGGVELTEQDHSASGNRGRVERFAAFLAALRIDHNPFYGVIRRHALMQTRLLGAHLAADRCLLAELSLIGPFEEVPERLFFRRKHEGNSNIGLDREWQKYRPGARAGFDARNWRVAREHLRTVLQAQLETGERVALLQCLVEWVGRERRDFGRELVEMVKSGARKATSWRGIRIVR